MNVQIDWSLADPSLLSAGEIDLYLRNLAIPYRFDDSGLVVAAGDPKAQSASVLGALFGEPVTILVCEKDALISYLERQFRERLSRDAVFALANHEPQFCARQVITREQSLIMVTAALCLGTGLVFEAYGVTLLLIVLLACGFVANVAFRAMLVWVGAGQEKFPRACTADMRDDSFPVYSILVPLYREARVLPDLVRSLELIDYPKERLDIKLIVEEDDTETGQAADMLAAAPLFEIVRVPFSLPRTKPKACNYALRFVRGDYVVIFDAEDRPEPDQLRKALAAFRGGPPDLGCVQACLNFFNASENWLTRGIMAQVPQAI